jgi:hypothetical protein
MNLRSWIVEKPNILCFLNTLSNSIPCISNYPFIMGNQFTKTKRNHVTDMLIKYDNVFPFSMKDLGRCKHVVLYKPYK